MEEFEVEVEGTVEDAQDAKTEGMSIHGLKSRANVLRRPSLGSYILYVYEEYFHTQSILLIFIGYVHYFGGD